MSKIHVDGLVPTRTHGIWQRETRAVSGRLTHLEKWTMDPDETHTIDFAGTTRWMLFYVDTESSVKVSIGTSESATAYIETVEGVIYTPLNIEVQALTISSPASGTDSHTHNYYLLAALKEEV
jgi:hypothetical protein